MEFLQSAGLRLKIFLKIKCEIGSFSYEQCVITLQKELISVEYNRCIPIVVYIVRGKLTQINIIISICLNQNYERIYWLSGIYGEQK